MFHLCFMLASSSIERHILCVDKRDCHINHGIAHYKPYLYKFHKQAKYQSSATGNVALNGGIRETILGTVSVSGVSYMYLFMFSASQLFQINPLVAEHSVCFKSAR